MLPYWVIYRHKPHTHTHTHNGNLTVIIVKSKNYNDVIRILTSY